MSALSAPTAARSGCSCSAGARRAAAPLRPSLAFRSGPLAARKQTAPSKQWRTHAEGEDQQPSQQQERPKPTVAPPRGKKEKEDQTVAIVTGAISVVIGFLYLAGVVLLNQRGNQMVPPPPEAFGWLLSAAVKGLL